VRFISNPSTGKMGLALAHEARARGAAVTVVLGPVAEAARDGLEVVDVQTAEEMAREALARAGQADFFVATAAVSDYRPKHVAPQKIKKSDEPEVLDLVRTPDVLLEVSRQVRQAARRPVLVGFAAETERVLEYAGKKLAEKGLDFIVANDVKEPGAGFGGDANHVHVLAAAGSPVELRGSKREVAAKIWDVLSGRGHG
jgi:phosphopantothenoylcysteine decarboxylase/phosphopantothenate--cysteine ligase